LIDRSINSVYRLEGEVKSIFGCRTYNPRIDQRDLILLESAITAIDEATSAVAREVERDRLGESSLARLSTVEAELRRSRLALEKIVQEEAR